MIKYLPVKSVILIANLIQRKLNNFYPIDLNLIYLHYSNPPIQSNDMAGLFTDRPKQISNLHWQPDQPVAALVRTFSQIKYLPFSNALPDLDQAIFGDRLNCGLDLHKQLIDYGGAAKVWMTVQVEYEQVNSMAKKNSHSNNIWALHQLVFTNKTDKFLPSQIRILTPFGFSQIGSGSLLRNLSSTSKVSD